MVSDVRKKEIKILKGLKDSKRLDSICSGLGINTMTYIEIVNGMKKKGSYPDIPYTCRECCDGFNVDLAIKYLEVIDRDDYYFEESSASSYVKNCDIESLMMYYEGLYSCKVSGGVRSAIRIGYNLLDLEGFDTSKMMIILQSFKNKKHASADSIKAEVNKIVNKKRKVERQETARKVEKDDMIKMISSLERGVSEARGYHKDRELELLDKNKNSAIGNNNHNIEVDSINDISCDNRSDISMVSHNGKVRDDMSDADKRADVIGRDDKVDADKRAMMGDPKEGDSIFNKRYSKDDFINKYNSEILNNMSNEIVALYIEWEKNICKIDLSLVLGVEACYKTCNERGVETLSWLNDAYKIVFRKLSTGSIKVKSRGIHYFVAMIRNWQNFGRGSNGWWQDMYVINFIENKYNLKLSDECKQELYSLMGKFGCMPILALFCEGKKDSLIKKCGIETFIFKRCYYCICDMRDNIYHMYS